jgi:DNA-binding transcriptional MerR regulator/methylmalonyl-CoA mutase cobalamin-binding subunit
VYHVQTVYNIKQAAARAGVSVPVLRAWERRYGIVSPERSASGYRRFDDESVARVQTMRSLVDEGWSPSAAAAAIIDGRVAVDHESSGRTSAGQSTAPIASAPSGSRAGISPERGGETAAGDIANELVSAARTLDAGRLDRVLDDLFSRGSFERVATDLLFPALQRLGDAWAAGDVSVAGEHLASNAVLRRLGLALDAAGSGDRGGPPIIVGLPPGGRHELGALAFAVAARRAGMRVAYLGPDLPIEDWIGAAEGAAAAVIGVVTARDRRAALEVGDGIRSVNRAIVVAFGGRAAPEAPYVLHLDGSLASSVAMLREALAGSSESEATG